MSFLNLLAFWIAAAVIPALLILYFLKLRRREEPISSTLLWKRAVQDLQVNAPFQRLRKNLLLFLQLLVLAAAIFALARPIVQSSGIPEGRLVILIDRSASMNTWEGNETRLDQAKEQAVRLVKTLNRRSESWLSFLQFGGAKAKTQAMVIAFADRASVVAPFTPNTADLVDVIQAIEPTDERTNIHEALELAEAYMSPPTMTTDQTPISAEAAAKVVLISDGGLADVQEAVVRAGHIDLIKVGQARDNVAITALRTRRSYEQPEILNVFLQLQNFGEEQVSTAVSLYLDGVLADARVRTVQLGPAAVDRAAPTSAPGEQEGQRSASGQGLSFELVLERAAVIEARLARDDALPVDNRAYAVVPPPQKLRVLVVTARNFFLDSVLGGLPLQERVFITPGEYEVEAQRESGQDRLAGYDAVIFDKYSPGQLPPGNYLFLGAVPPLEGVAAAEPLEQVHALVWWDETHPVLRHVALEYVYVANSLPLRLPAEAEALIEGPRGPLLARYARDGRHCLILGFAVENSTWWQKPSFPVFAYNAIRYLGGGGTAEQEPVHPGGTLSIPLPGGVTEARLTCPGGRTETLKPDAAGMVYFGGTQQVGVYRAGYEHAGEKREDRYAINLEDVWESDIRPRGAAELKSPQITAGQAIETATPEIWRWFIGGALLVVLLEWYIYNRRVMI